MFEKGSGLWLTASRVAALEAWLDSATPPVASTSTVFSTGSSCPKAVAASTAAPTGRITV